MAIESQEELKKYVEQLLVDSETFLAENDDLPPTLLVIGEQQLVNISTGPLPPAAVNALASGFIERDPSADFIAYVSLGLGSAEAQLRPSLDPAHFYVISATVTHRDWGNLSAYVRFERKITEGKAGFTFQEPGYELANTHPLLENIWPARAGLN